MNTSSYDFKNNSLSRLLSAALAINDNGVKDGTNIKDFKIALLFQIQMIIHDYVIRVFELEYGFLNQITKSVREDFDRTVGWLALIAKSSSENLKKEPDRTRDLSLYGIQLNPIV